MLHTVAYPLRFLLFLFAKELYSRSIRLWCVHSILLFFAHKNGHLHRENVLYINYYENVPICTIKSDEFSETGKNSQSYLNFALQ